MFHRVSVSTGVGLSGDAAVVVKRASGTGAAAERLRLEGERLRRASHPGVVSVVRSAPSGDGWELVLQHAGRPLAALGPPTPRQAGVLVAAIASTLADLHDLGLVHGRIDASHVLLGVHGRPVLCGFGDGGDDAAPADDVAALGRLLTDLVGSDDEGEPIPERRWRRRRHANGWERRMLLALADQAVADPPSRRPTARRLAAALSEAMPIEASTAGATVPGTEDDDDPMERWRGPVDRGGSPSTYRRAMGLAVAGVTFVLLGVRHLSASGSSAARSDLAPDPSDEVRTAEAVTDSIVVQDGKRYRIGRPGDHLLVDDWRCDGQPTAAVFRPDTQEVFVFSTWTATEPLTVDAITEIPGAVAMVSQRSADGCPTLALRTETGDAVPVDLGAVG